MNSGQDKTVITALCSIGVIIIAIALTHNLTKSHEKKRRPQEWIDEEAQRVAKGLPLRERWEEEIRQQASACMAKRFKEANVHFYKGLSILLKDVPTSGEHDDWHFLSKVTNWDEFYGLNDETTKEVMQAVEICMTFDDRIWFVPHRISECKVLRAIWLTDATERAMETACKINRYAEDHKKKRSKQ